MGQSGFFGLALDRRLSIEAMDAWVSIPFIMIMLLAGLQAMPKEVLEGSQGRRCGWMAVVPACDVSSHAAGEHHRPSSSDIFKLKLADIVINVTAGGRAAPPTRSQASSIGCTVIDRMSIRHGARDVLSLMIIVLLDAVAAPVQTLDAETCLNETSNPLLKGVARLAILTSTSQSVHGHRTLVPGHADSAARADLWRVAVLGLRLPVSDLLRPSRPRSNSALDVTQVIWLPADFSRNWKGWRSLGLSPDSIPGTSTARDEFMSRSKNSISTSVGASVLALVSDHLAAYGLSRFRYKFGWMATTTFLFFFMSQLILPPVVLALRVPRSLQGAVAA